MCILFKYEIVWWFKLKRCIKGVFSSFRDCAALEWMVSLWCSSGAHEPRAGRWKGVCNDREKNCVQYWLFSLLWVILSIFSSKIYKSNRLELFCWFIIQFICYKKVYIMMWIVFCYIIIFLSFCMYVTHIYKNSSTKKLFDFSTLKFVHPYILYNIYCIFDVVI